MGWQGFWRVSQGFKGFDRVEQSLFENGSKELKSVSKDVQRWQGFKRGFEKVWLNVQRFLLFDKVSRGFEEFSTGLEFKVLNKVQNGLKGKLLV